jgi:hypothetical protein
MFENGAIGVKDIHGIDLREGDVILVYRFKQNVIVEQIEYVPGMASFNLLSYLMLNFMERRMTLNEPTYVFEKVGNEHECPGTFKRYCDLYYNRK